LVGPSAVTAVLLAAADGSYCLRAARKTECSLPRRGRGLGYRAAVLLMVLCQWLRAWLSSGAGTAERGAAVATPFFCCAACLDTPASVASYVVM